MSFTTDYDGTDSLSVSSEEDESMCLNTKKCFRKSQ